MAIKCGNLHLFNASEDQGHLISTVGPVFLNSKGKSVEKIYNSLIKALKEQGVFKFGENEFTPKQLDLYKNSMLELKQELIKISKIYLTSTLKKQELSKFFTMIEENLYVDGGLSSDDVIKIEEPSEPEIEGIDQETEDKRNSLTLENALKKIYGTCINARQQREDEFDVSIVNVSMIDQVSRKVITTVQDLNKSIGQYKNSQYRNIVKYLNSTNSEYQFSEQMFDENGILTREYYKVMGLFYNIIENSENLSDSIYNEWEKVTLDKEDSNFLSAINAYVNLQYFDNLLKDKLGKGIELIDDKFFGCEIDLGYNKYTFGKSNEHKVKSWSTTDNKDAINNIAKFSKLALKIVKINSSLDGKFQNKYVNIQNFCTAITHMFNALRKSGISDLNTLRKLAARFHSNPYFYSKKLFKELSEVGEKLIGENFTRLDLDILTSVYSQVYDTDNPNSIISIETRSLKQNFSIDSYSIIDSINGVIDRTMEANYLQVKFQDNGYDVSIKKKYASRKNSYSLVNKINIKNSQASYSRRRQLSEQYPIYRLEDSKVNYDIKIGENTHINVKAKDGILSQKSSLTINNKNYESLFNPNSTDIDFQYNTIKRIISGEKLNEKEQLFRDVLEFIDTFLDLNLLSENGLNILNIYKLNLSSNKNYIEDILLSAVRAAAVNDFYKRYQDTLEDNEYINPIKFEEFMDNEYFISSKGVMDKKSKHKNYYTNRFGTYILNSVNTSEEWVDKFIFAESVFTGEANKSTTKDLFGNNIGNYRTSYLGGNIFYYLDKYENDPDENLAAKSLMFTQQSNLIKDVVINTDIQSRFGDIKQVRNMKPAELFYTHIVNNFYGSYVSSEKNPLSGCFVIQPTVYSDKVTFINYAIDANKIISKPDGVNKKSYHGKTLATLTSDELIEYYNDTIGVAYKRTFNNVLNDFRRLFNNSDMTLDQISEVLKQYNEDTLIKLAQRNGIEIQQDTHYRVDSDGNLRLNELLYHYSDVLHNDIRNLKKRFNLEKTEFLNDLLDSGISFYTNYATDITEEDADIRQNNLIRKIINNDKLFSQAQIAEIKSKWIKNGKLILAKVDGKDILSGKRIESGKDVQLNPILEKYFYTDLLLSNNLRFALTGSEIAHPDKSKVNLQKEYKLAGITVDNAPKEIIEINSKGKRVLTNDLIKLSRSSSLPIKAIYDKCLRKIEAVAQGTQFKRNVIIPATLQYEQMNALNGITSKLKVAIIKDTKAATWNFRGDNNKKLDAHDGSAWINPFESVLENKALQDQEVGVDKKPIWHHYNARTMSTTLLKFATFTITNERMRTSLDGDIDLYNLFRRMTDIKWQNEDGSWNFRNPGVSEDQFNEQMSKFNLTTTIGFKANKYSKLNFIKDILQDKELFYKEDRSNHKLICGFGYDEKGYYTEEKLVTNLGTPLGDTPVIKYYHKFDKDSNHYKFTEDQEIPENLSDINSLFQLFNALGGIYSESLVDGQLAYSDQSIYATVNFMNNVCIRTGDSNDMSQNSYYQPLKEMMIAYAANSSAVKVGASNVNKSEAWSNQDELTYMELNADGLGIQMDADHEIDEAEMTEFSQVVSAITAGGRLHDVAKDVYQSLGKLALQASSMELDAVNNFIEEAAKLSKDDKEKYERQLEILKSSMYDIIGRVVINNYSPNNDRIDLAKPIIDEISKLFNVYDNHILSPLKLAFSDSNLYSTILSSFMSNLNKKSIKRKYPGSGCVMAPGYGIIQTYKINGTSYQYDDLIREATNVNRKKRFFRKYNPSQEDIVTYNKQLVKTYLQSLQNEEYQNNSKLNLDSFIPTDIVDVCVINQEDGNYVKVSELNFNEIDDYYRAKTIPNYVQNVLRLKTSRVIWAHPGTGKTYLYNQGRKDIIDFDSEYKYKLGNVEQRKELKKQIGKEAYNAKLDELFEEARNEAVNSGKILLVSDLHFLRDRSEDLDAITNISNEEFIQRSRERNEINNDDDIRDKLDWKNSINLALENVDPSKVLNVSGYLSTFLPKNIPILSNFNPEQPLIFAQNVTRSRNLAPARITWSQDGKQMNIFDTEEVANSFGYSFKLHKKIQPIENRKAIQKVFDDLEKGIYNGKEIQNFKNEEAELIMSNMYASTFGLRTDDSLQEILRKGPNAFKIIKLPTINISNFEMCFTTNTNDNLYFTFKNLHGSGIYAPKKRNWRIKPDGNEVWHINKEGEKQFQVGAYIKRDDLVYDSDGKVFRTLEGELINNKDHKYKVGLNGEVLEYYEYISCYDVIEKCGDKLVTRQVYKINKENIAPTLNVREGQESVGGVDINGKIGGILSDIYSNGSYTGIRLNTQFSRKSAQQLEPLLDVMRDKVDDRTRDLIIGTKKYLSDVHNSKESDVYIVDKKIDGVSYTQFLIDYYNSIANDRFASFLKSLTYTSSRIPAQTLQSFMKMRLVGFTNSSKNICYVSHWQTYLQGSDYDIDKAYIMGLQFDENGMYVGWSDLFDYSSIENIEASETLPIPNKKVAYLKSDLGINITNFITSINSAETKAKRIIEYAKLLRYLDEFINKDTKQLNLKWDSSIIPDELGKEVLNTLNRHSNTRLTGKKLEQAMKNQVSSHIQKIIQNPRNMDQAYTSIDGEMDRIRKAAELSPKGEKSTNMTMMNPLTKFLMQVTNMVGKGVIGIAATGEKTFFNLTTYWNEGIRKGNNDWIENMKFQKTFNRIQGRSKGEIKSKICSTLANVNFENYDQVRRNFVYLARIDSEVRQEMGITDRDILLKNEKWRNYQSELFERVKQSQDSDQYVDLNISALLSAATDNAKELILDKINAGLNLAKCYIHLMMMGFSIDDIVKFMTSPAVSLVNEISEANMFDEYLPKIKVDEAIEILKGSFNLDKFFPGTIQSQAYDAESGNYTKTTKASDDAFIKFAGKESNLRKKLEELALKEIKEKQSKDANDYKFCQKVTIKSKTELLKLREKYGELLYDAIEKKDKSIEFKVIVPTRYNAQHKNKIIQDYFYARTHGLIKESLNELIPSTSKSFNKRDNNISALSDYIDMLVSKIESYNNLEEFESDLEEFEKVYELAEETSTLGSRLLKLNQGLPTSEYDLITLMLQLQNAFDVRVKKFNFEIKDEEDKLRLFGEIHENNPLLDWKVFQEAFRIGKDFDLIENFDIEKWLYDDKYKEATAKFYNIIKGTWNIFDVIDKLPHYSAIFDLLRMSIQSNNNLSKKSHIIWLAVKKMYKGQTNIDVKEFNNLVRYVDGLLIVDFVNKSGLSFPIFKDQEYFLDNFEREKASTDCSKISLDSESKRATFKLRFERMIEDLKNGTYQDIENGEVITIEDENLKNNEFIKNLVSDINQNGSTMFKLNLDMQQVSATPYNSKKYQDCLNGFIKLKNYKFNGRPLTDWFMLYNFLINRNMWGSDRLTSLFGPFLNIINENSLIKEYFEFSGNQDWKNFIFSGEEEILQSVGFNEQDAWFAAAKIISENQELYENAHTVKEFKNGAMIIKEKKRYGAEYKEVNLFNSLMSLHGSSAEDAELIRQSDYMNYSIIQTPFANKLSSRISTIYDPPTYRSLVLALNDLVKDGIIKISKENC